MSPLEMEITINNELDRPWTATVVVEAVELEQYPHGSPSPRFRRAWHAVEVQYRDRVIPAHRLPAAMRGDLATAVRRAALEHDVTVERCPVLERAYP